MEKLQKPNKPQPIAVAEYPAFLHPKTMREINTGDGLVLSTTAEGKLNINGQLFPCAQLEKGLEVRVFGEPYNVHVFSNADYQAYEKAWSKYRAELDWQQAVERKKLAEQKAKLVKDFWAKYNIPFKFSMDIKERLSGLSANSSGNGTVKNTVLHVVLKEDYKEGRLQRKAGDFLCSPSVSKSGGNWSGTLGDGVHEQQNICDCKGCMDKLKKWEV